MLENRSLNRRINYAYLARLEDKLKQLGHSLTDWPDYLIEQTWPAHRDYMKDELRLDYCVRCHLPIAAHEVSEDYKDMCLEHAANAKQTIAKRRQLAKAHYVTKLSKRPNLDRIDPRIGNIIRQADEDYTIRKSLPTGFTREQMDALVNNARTKLPGHVDDSTNEPPTPTLKTDDILAAISKATKRPT